MSSRAPGAAGSDARGHLSRRAAEVRIALLSDVHGNLPALQAALAEADRRGAEQIVFAGDAVGDGPDPVEVCRLLGARAAAAIRGNVDAAVLRHASGPGARWRHRLRAASGKLGNRAWTATQLDPESRAWLGGLPADLQHTIAASQMRLVHGSPLGDQDPIFPSITATALKSKLGDARPDVLVCGHTHVPFTRAIEGVRVVNCGSVGRPKDGDPRGSFGLVTLGRVGVPRAEVIRFHYDVEQVIRTLKERGVPGVRPREYRRGVKE